MALSKPLRDSPVHPQPSPLTVENLQPMLQRVQDGWRLVAELGVPESKRKAFREQFGSNENGAVPACIQWWLQHATSVSWREIVHKLDWIRETGVADTIRQYLEPPTDPSLTVENVRKVMEGVREWRSVGVWLLVPQAIRDKIAAECSSNDERISALASYVVTTIPSITWEDIAGVLYRWDEERAVERVKPYIQRFCEPTFTAENVMEMTRAVEYHLLTLNILDVPVRVSVKIRDQYQSEEQRREAAVSHILLTHPCASWRWLSRRLQKYSGYSAAAAVAVEVSRKYVKASEETRQLLQQALKGDKRRIRNSIFVITGAAGSGKSSVMAAAMGEPPPETRESTGCATNPVRGMTTSRLSTTGTTWKRVSFSELLQEVATMFKVIAVRRVGPTVCVQIECDDTASPSSGGAPQEQEQAALRSEATPTSPPTEQHSTTQPTQPQPIGSDVVEELGSRIESGMVYESSELFEVDWVNVIDSGGQPSFHELLPFFMQDPSAVLFTFKLSEALSAHYMVAYYENGKSVGEPYRSNLSNEQILSSCMRSIQSLASHKGEGGKGTKIAFIGTHRDLEEECVEETRAQKEEKLQEIIPPSLRQHVLRSGNVNEFIFSLDTLEPDENDEVTIASLREKLMEMSPAEWKEIPPSWYAFELALQALAEREGRRVLTVEECKVEAHKLLMDDKSTMAALRYLHGLNILFYYDDEGALPDVVFVSGQMLLDKITELVKKCHEIRGGLGPGSVLGGEWERFQNQAVVTRKQLEGFPKHYNEGIFAVDDLIKLFTYMPILAPIAEDTFFMPAILPAEENEQLITFIQSHIYLLFFFPDGIPFGVFCALNASLINHAGWSLLEESGRPVQVSRNRITFTLPDGNPGKVNLVDTFSNYIAVVVELSAEESLKTKICQKLCPIIRDTISTNICKAVAALHYTGIIPQLAFFCPKSNSACSTSSHAAIVISDHSGVTCSKKRSILCSLTEQNKMWFTGLQSTFSASGASGSDEHPTFPQLMCFSTGGRRVNIIERISIKYYEFGTLILEDDYGVKMSAIVEQCREDPNKINRQVLMKWLNGEGKKPVSWATLATELEHAGLSELAREIQSEKKL